MTRHPISPLKKDGFTLDGTGYFACHQESHRLLYAKTPWCRMTLTAILFVVPAAIIPLGIAFNVPVVVVIGAIWTGVLAWCYIPRKKKAQPTEVTS